MRELVEKLREQLEEMAEKYIALHKLFNRVLVSTAFFFMCVFERLSHMKTFRTSWANLVWQIRTEQPECTSEQPEALYLDGEQYEFVDLVWGHIRGLW